MTAPRVDPAVVAESLREIGVRAGDTVGLHSDMPSLGRIMVQVLVISFYVIILHLVLKAFAPEISRVIGPYVGLIITNCILMGRLEAFATANPPWASFVDGIGCGLGYGFILIGIAVVRELTGFGTLLGVPVLGAWWTRWTLMVMPAGAFFMLGLFVWAFRYVWEKGENEEAA